ncbi:hypothetical protein ACOSQ2_012221 [Xanthoceras sorbifolium]
MNRIFFCRIETHLLDMPQDYVNKVPRPWFFFLVLLITVSLLFLSNEVEAASMNDSQVTDVGVIIDVSSRKGKEVITAMEIAVQNFNSSSRNHKLNLHIRDHERQSLQAAMAAEELIEKKNVKLIIGMDTWEEAGLVADIGSRDQVPILSFAAPAISPPSMSVRWPFLIRMASNDSEQMNCIAALVQFYNWRRVSVIYEDSAYGGDPGKSVLLSEALQNIGSQIEHRLVLPPISSISDPKNMVQGELRKVQNKQSRVFILLQSSLPMAIHLFREAKEMGLVGRDSVWIVTDTIADFLDSFNNSVISSMEGTLGIKNYYSQKGSNSYGEFADQFRRNFMTRYPEEDHMWPGIHALRAYDSIRIVTQALERLSANISSPKMLLENVLKGNFSGLNGRIHFKEGELLDTDTFRIVNVVGKKYKELDFWLPNYGFSKTLIADTSDRTENFSGPVLWPGNLNRIPKGWAMPTNEQPMRIGVPEKTFFEKFVKIESVRNSQEKAYKGFSIELFDMVLTHLGYNLPHEFVPHVGSYDDLVYGVYNKTYDAAIGDVTILDNRTNYVDFTQPYAESGLSMIVPVKLEDSTWLFMKPFTTDMWVATAATFIYTMFIVWFLEHQSNQQFRGSRKDQMSTVLWFMFSSIFYAHKEKIYSNYSRAVVVLWLFIVFVLTSSYTASLSSLLTVQRLQPSVTDIDFLMRNNLNVGCDNDSFVRNYLSSVLKFNPDNVNSFGNDEATYLKEFESNHIAALFLERPYEKVFLNKYCKKYTTTTTYRFGGFGFAFPKGSPIGPDISRAILYLSENGELEKLEEKWFRPSPECSTDKTSPESLTLHSFWGLYLLYASTSSICFLLFLFRLVKNSHGHIETYTDNTTQSNRGGWNKVIKVVRNFHKGRERGSSIGRASGSAQPRGVSDEWGSSKWAYVSPSDVQENHQVISLQDEIEMGHTQSQLKTSDQSSG